MKASLSRIRENLWIFLWKFNRTIYSNPYLIQIWDIQILVFFNMINFRNGDDRIDLMKINLIYKILFSKYKKIKIKSFLNNNLKIFESSLVFSLILFKWKNFFAIKAIFYLSSWVNFLLSIKIKSFFVREYFLFLFLVIFIFSHNLID